VILVICCLSCNSFLPIQVSRVLDFLSKLKLQLATAVMLNRGSVLSVSSACRSGSLSASWRRLREFYADTTEDVSAHRYAAFDAVVNSCCYPELLHMEWYVSFIRHWHSQQAVVTANSQSVHLSVQCRYCIKMIVRIVKLFRPHDRSIGLVFEPHHPYKIPRKPAQHGH